MDLAPWPRPGCAWRVYRAAPRRDGVPVALIAHRGERTPPMFEARGVEVP